MRWLVVVALAACTAPDRGPRWQPAGASTPRVGGTLRLAIKDTIRTLDPDDRVRRGLELRRAPAVRHARRLRAREHRARAARSRSAGSARGTARRTGSGCARACATATARRSVAHDFKFSLERALTTPDSPFGPFLVDVRGARAVLEGTARAVTGITAPTDRELVIELARPSAAFLYVLTMTFATPQRADHVAAAGDQLRRRPLGSGPYVLAGWDEGDAARAAPEPALLRPDARLPRRDRRCARTSRAILQFLMFERGELDVAERLSAPDLLWVTSQPAWAAVRPHAGADERVRRRG